MSWPLLAAALALTGCPNQVPDAGQFGAKADSTANNASDLGSAADTTSGVDTGTDSAAADTTLSDAALNDVAASDAAVSDTGANPDDSVSMDAVLTGTDASTPPTDAGCASNGCGTAPACKTLTCQANGSCATGNAANNSGCGPAMSCHGGLCLADTPKALRVVAAGGTTCTLVEGGAVLCWGDGNNGQLGDNVSGNGHSSAIPMAVPGISGASDLACGPSHCCAVVAGNVLCWGENGYGGCNPTVKTSPLFTPTQVPGIFGATAVAAGGYHSCAIVAGGKVKCWGLGTAGQLGTGQANIPDTVVDAKLGTAAAVQVRAGPNHTCIRTATGTGLCWGYNENGELGDGNGGTSQEADSPVPISALQGMGDLATGEYHGCALVAGGSVRCWGHNSSGQLGTGGGNSYYSTPQVVALNSAIGVAAGGSHSCAAVTGGGVWCWGDNGSGQLGSASNSKLPAEIKGFYGVVEVAAGTSHTCARRDDGSIWCWGENLLGQCGPLTGKGGTTPAQAY